MFIYVFTLQMYQSGFVIQLYLMSFIKYKKCIKNHLIHLLTGVPAIAALLQLLILPFCPESPPWLHITKSRVDEASKALKRFRGAGSSIEGELAAYSEEKVEQDNREQVRVESRLRAHIVNQKGLG